MRWWCAAGTWSHSDPPAGFDVYVLKTATLLSRPDPCSLLLRVLPDGGYLNRVGVRNPGLAVVLAGLPIVPGKLVVSILGFDVAEWRVLAERANEATVDGLELNLSCPNAEAEPVGTDPAATANAVRAAREVYKGQLGAKLPPTAPADVARACEAEGVDYLCLVNALDTPLGGLSGRPLRALALDCIARVAGAVPVLIVGGGGLLTRDDAQLYLDAGAIDVFMATGNLLNGAGPEATSD